MPTRRLAAIMFTDIAGYTAMMQSDEAQALQIRERHRSVFEQSHHTHRGNILQYYGDGTLSIFDSAIDAVNCAIEMQLSFQESPQVPLRIGIHTGDILYTKEEAVGDGVNVASRVESLAVPGSIFFSDSVQAYIQNQVNIPVQSMGEFTFKNVDKPMEVFAVNREDLVVPNPKTLTGKFVKHVRPGQQNLFQRLPIWAKYVGGFALFLMLAPIIYFPLLQVVSGTAASNDMVTVTDEHGHTMERMIIKAEDQTRLYMTEFNNDGDSSLNWAIKAIPYALEMDWDQDPYIFNIFSEWVKSKSLNEEIEAAHDYDCQYVLKGNVNQTDGRYQVGIRLYSVSNGQMESEYSYEGSEILPMIDTISLDLKRKLGIPESHLKHVKDLPVWQFLTASEEAFQHFGSGLYDRNNGMFFPFEKFNQALTADSTAAWIAMYTSNMLHRFQRSKQMAIQLSEQAMRHRKRLPDIFEAEIRQLYYEVHDQPEQALQLTQMLAKLHPENTSYQTSLISQYFMQDDYEATLETINQYRELIGDPHASIDAQMISLLRLDRAQEAIPILQAYIKEHPGEADKLVKLGQLYTATEDWDQATQTFEQAILLSPESKSYQRLLESIRFSKDSSSFLNPEALKEFEGTYWVQNYTGFELHIQERNGRLIAHATNQSKYELYPLSMNLFTATFDFTMRFERDDKGRVVRMHSSEKGWQEYPAIKMEEQMITGIQALKARKWEAARSNIQAMAEAYPQHLFLERLRQHLEYRAKGELSKKKPAYQQLVGIYQAEDTKLNISLDQYGTPLYKIDESNILDSDPLYEIEKDVFTGLLSLNTTFHMIRKQGKVIGLQTQKDNGESFRFEKIE